MLLRVLCSALSGYWSAREMLMVLLESRGERADEEEMDNFNFLSAKIPVAHPRIFVNYDSRRAPISVP